MVHGVISYLIKKSVTRSLMLCFVMLIQFNGDIYAESKPPKTIRMIAEPNSQWFLDGKMKYGCEVVMDSGRKRRTRGYLSGDISWKKIRVSSDQAVSNSDKLTVDLEKVKANHNTLSLDIFWVGDENIHAHFDYKIPELKSIDLFLDDQIKIKPGKTFTPKALFTFENGLRYSCNPWDKKALVHSDQVVLFFGRDEVPDGRITIPENAATKSEQLNVSMVWKSNQNVYDLKVLPLEITPEESLDIEVLSGSTGRHGRLGSTNQDGWIGEVGGVGHDAPEVNVYMWMNDDSTYLIINTICLSEKKSFQLKPGADVMKINVQGGKGGRGGRGGTGGDGAPGTDDSGGFGGEGGQGGQGGKGGLVIIHCDPKAELHLNQLNINNAGGEGGEGGYGGKGGRRADYDGNVTLFEALFPDRNSRGYDGPQGDWGANGPEAEVNVLDKAEVQRLWNSIVP